MTAGYARHPRRVQGGNPVHVKNQNREPERNQKKDPGNGAARTATLGGEGDCRLSRKEHREDALALRAEERRDKLRKAAGSCK